MRTIETLVRADQRLSEQIDAVALALNGVGAHTAAARQRLALALSAARDRLAAELDAVAAAVCDLAEGIDALAGCDLLALPESVRDPLAVDGENLMGNAMKEIDEAAPSPAPEALECSRCGRLSEQRLCGPCNQAAAEADWANDDKEREEAAVTATDVIRQAGELLADGSAEEVSRDIDAAYDHLPDEFKARHAAFVSRTAEAAPPSNGKPKSKRRR